jgi:hypothetical protein
VEGSNRSLAGEGKRSQVEESNDSESMIAGGDSIMLSGGAA